MPQGETKYHRIVTALPAPNSVATLEKLPAIGDRPQPDRLTLHLKDEQAIASLEKEFAMFVESEKSESAEALGHARCPRINAALKAA